jgi:hypothetical protein
MDDGTNGKKEIVGGETPTDARLFCRGLRPRPRLDRQAHIYRRFQKNAWASRESVSGTGSELNRTYHLRRELPVLLSELKVRSLLDLPCGDFNWMAHVELGDIRYVGADIIAELIDRNQKL